MATKSDLDLARKLVLALDVYQSQGSLFSQVTDCIPIVEALGYYDLVDYLRDQFNNKEI